MTVDRQSPDEIVDHLLRRTDDDELVLYLDEETELPVSIRRPLHLPSSVQGGVEGGSIRYSVLADDQAVEELELPAREGVIAAEELEPDSWTRSRIEFHDQHAEDEFGDLERSDEVVAVADSS
ncbi:hypothetical protein [Natronococcus sp.]|uniref:hypothetical protein n=1 Tax=Natronococcus sp. TaxID=35747 RepID=UPI0025EA87FE|nr:hypothetical protein [Natronococcus sp.]